MPSRAYASFLPLIIGIFVVRIYGKGVNALTGLCLISTTRQEVYKNVKEMCQCPHGLMPHFYEKLKIDLLGMTDGVNALTGLCLISTVPLQKPRFYAVSRACFCRYLSEYSDSNCFSCMLTI